MKRWAFLVVLIYVMILAWLAIPFMAVLFIGQWDSSDVERTFGSLEGWRTLIFDVWPFWIALGIMALAQVALLAVPVRIANRRPVRRRHVFWTLAAAIFAMVVMSFGILVTVIETAQNSGFPRFEQELILGAGVLWGIWMFLFGFYTGGREPRIFMSRVVNWLIAGSIIELLVAVPAHMLARSRNYCCAGFGTGFGLATGLSVMLFAFGPAVLALFARRYWAIKNPPAQVPDEVG